MAPSIGFFIAFASWTKSRTRRLRCPVAPTGCRFPGCHRTKFVDGHHIEHWADGGETRLDNLVSVCMLIRDAPGRPAKHHGGQAHP
ncbi:MAG: HNH endonuclease [Gammaproteobacteria bacterium]|nr:HNH endonuclease [Gammaproteobacteria bacterium]